MSIARHHAEWLKLIEVSGPFLSMPVFLRCFPQGMDKLDREALLRLRAAYEEWLETERGPGGDPAIHQAWVRFVLRDTLELPEALLLEGQAIPAGLCARRPEYGEILRPDLVLAGPQPPSSPGAAAAATAAPASPTAPAAPSPTPTGAKPRLLVQVLPAGQDLEGPLRGARSKASPGTRMMELLHAVDVPLGLVTNGERWMLVYARRGETTGFASWYADHWLDESITLQAWTSLLSVRRFFGSAGNDTLEALLDQSATDQQEVTDQLGYQVRKAVELLVQAIDRIDQDRGRNLLHDTTGEVNESHLYEACVTVMMRLVFLFAAEERGLLPIGELLYNQNYAVSTLGAQLREAADRHGEEVLERRHDAWSRLLATFRAVHGGVEHESLRLRGYGGHLYDPDRYPFLEGRVFGTHWRTSRAEPLPIDNRTVLHLLEALQFLQVKLPGGGPAEARRLSFRALDIEQIGHVYEGLLDHEAVRAEGPVLGLAGTKALEPEIALPKLEAKRRSGEAELVEFLSEETGRSAKALAKALAGTNGDGEPGSDAHGDGKLLAACGNDGALCSRVKPFAGLLRMGPRGYPVVIGAGGVYVTEGATRRSTGTHYTPRSLTEPVVRYTLEPLVYAGPADGQPPEAWKLRSARELLALRVCDVAMGSGAFLVQACRYLSEKVVEAWEAAEGEHPGRVVITPEGDLSNGDPGERPIPQDPAERLTLARRVVADRCLYGVDVNPMAVEMGKMSLWLATLQKDRPFGFLDHALRCGDSLLGITRTDQIAWFHLDPARGKAIHEGLFQFTAAFRPAFEAALEKRLKLESFPVLELRDAEEKARLQREAEDGLARVRLLCDAIVLCALDVGEATLDALDQELLVLASGFAAALDPRRSPAEQERLVVEVRKRVADLRGVTHDPQERPRRPFHWLVEFPEILGGAEPEGRGFDAIIGNPPFRGGQLLRQTLGGDYRGYLVEHVGGGKRGSADLCAYFFLRAAGLLKARGTFGLLATNTIAQGDTREVGLDRLIGEGSTVYRAVPSRKWPGEATLEVAEVWMRRGAWAGEHVLNDVAVRGISGQLGVKGAVEGTPYRLAANVGKSFQGSIVLGMGFVLTPEEARALIAKNPRNRDVLFPYLNGEDLNSRPDQSASRWVINFQDWPLERAEEYTDCMRIVREKVKPERDLNNRKCYRENWWHHAEKRPDLYAALARLERVLAIARVTHHFGIASVARHHVFSEQLYIFPFALGAEFPVLQCSLHETWARTYSSTLETRLRYSPTDCLETFPFPTLSPDLADLARRYHDYRASIMRTRDEGLTKTYNRFHNPDETQTKSQDIVALRNLHVALDRAVAAAYGWSCFGSA